MPLCRAGWHRLDHGGQPSSAGHGLRLAARALTAAQRTGRGDTRQVLQLLAQMAALADTITRLRENQHRAEQAAAARAAADLVRRDCHSRAAAAPVRAYPRAAATEEDLAAAARDDERPAPTSRTGPRWLPNLDPRMPQPPRRPGRRGPTAG